MRGFIIGIFLCGFVLFSHSLEASRTSSRQYIEVVSCSVQKGKIVVTSPDQVYEVKRLRTDSKGAYVCPSDIISVQKIEALRTAGPD
jgi:hypothetical protein